MSRLCSKERCEERLGKGYRCGIDLRDCPGEYTEEMLITMKVNPRDISQMKEEGLVK
jgi:hypothetical protein